MKQKYVYLQMPIKIGRGVFALKNFLFQSLSGL